MCADMKATSFITWEYAQKITPIGNSALLGCAGKDDRYISLFARSIKTALEKPKPEGTDYFDFVKHAVESFSEGIFDTNTRSGLANLEYLQALRVDVDQFYPEAVLAVRDSYGSQARYRPFELQPPHPPKEVDYPYRATAGSGGIVANIFLKNTEFLLAKLGHAWVTLSASLIAQFCFVLMHRIFYVEPHSLVL